MRCVFKTILVSFLFFPVIVQAACLDKGYSVVFVNGVFDTKDEAEQDKFVLQQKLKSNFSGEPIDIKLGYNQTHLAGAGDLLESAFPALDQYDLDTILMQMHADVTTRKILLVGHSQGAVYANKMYEYLIAHGVPKEDVAVYAVATPDSYVAGGGTYITYEFDDVINFYTRHYSGLRPLPTNATFAEFLNSPDSNATSAQGHGFIDMYLGGFGTRMVADMQEEMTALKSTAGIVADGCFDPPQNTLERKAISATFAIGDPVAVGIKTTGVIAYGITSTVGELALAGVGAAEDATGMLAAAFGFGSKQSKTKTSTISGLDVTGFNLLKAIAGSSLTTKDLVELNSKSQGGAVALALQQNNAENNGEVLGDETQKTDEAHTPASTPEQPVPFPSFPVGGGGSPGFGGEDILPTPEPEPTPVVATTTATSSPPSFTVLYEQTDVSTLGQTADAQVLVGLPAQRLGNNLSGTIGSVVYKINATDLATKIAAGWGLVQLFNCQGDFGYVPIGHCFVVSSGSPQIVSETGNDAELLSVMSSYTLSPSNYYFLRFIITGDMALYGSSSNTYGDMDTLAAWLPGADFVSYTLDTNGVVDWGFRICDTATCSF